MIDFLLVAHNLSSICLVIASWWLTHTYAAAGFPHGRLIAIGWSLVGMTVLVAMVARNIRIDPDPWIVATKCLLIAVAIVSAHRVSIRNRRIAELEGSGPERPA